MTVIKCCHMALKYSDIDKTIAMAMTSCRLYISADEVDVLNKIERWSSDSKTCCFYSITKSLQSLWGVCAGHLVYLRLLETNVPVRIKEESCENQRWNPVDGFYYRLLPIDRDIFFSCRWPREQRSSNYHTTKEGLDLGCWRAVRTSR